MQSRCRAATIVCGTLLLALCTGAVAAQDARTLAPGTSIAREISPGEEHIYPLAVHAGEFVHVAIEQERVDAAVRIVGNDGREWSSIGHDETLYGLKELSAIADQDDSLRIIVRAPKSRRDGRYGLRVDVRAATPQDKDRIEAERHVIVGLRLNRERSSPETIREALEHFEKAAAVWRQLNEPAREAAAVQGAAWSTGGLGDLLAAIAKFEEAHALFKVSGGEREEADILSDLGAFYIAIGEKAKALQYLEEASKKKSDPELQSQIATHIGIAYEHIGEAGKAMDAYLQALDLTRMMGDQTAEAYTLGHLSNLYIDRGDWQKAIDSRRRMLSIHRETGFADGQGTALAGLGDAYRQWGMDDRAVEYFNEALKLHRTTGNLVGEAGSLISLGDLYLQQNKIEAALDSYLQALERFESLSVPDGAAAAQMRLGRAYILAGELDNAAAFIESSLRTSRRTGRKLFEAQALSALAELHVAAGDVPKAIGCFSEALALHHSMASRAGEAATLFASARARMRIDDLTEANREIERALAIVEDLRSGTINRELRTSYFASVREMYEFQISLLMRLQRTQPDGAFEAAAFHVSERARARVLLEVLAESRTEIRQNVVPELQQRERELQQLLASKANRLMRSSGKNAREENELISREIEALTTEYEVVQEQIRTDSPRYASLTQPQPVTVAQLQDFLDSDTVLLEYFVSESGSFLWAVARDDLVSHELPKRNEIETMARELYDGLSVRTGRGEALTENAASELGRILLGPVAAMIDGKRLLIVADGVLQYVPFASLRLPDRRRLIAAHEIVFAPSASALASLRLEASSRATPPKVLAIFADPVFEKDDERVDRGPMRTAMKPRAEGALSIAVRDVGLGDEDIPRLPFTRREASAIAAFAPETMRTVALDFAASRPAVLREDLSDYRIIHFATHALLDSQRPEFSGIVLSLVDRRGREQDGFLPAAEVFNLKLRADLVVLSGCRTALGKEVRGEGLVGLTRGFMYAGATRVVASLWRVDDAATAELMRRFYEGMLGAKKLRPAAALRQAQMALAGTTRWREPYYWAGFVLQGEWN